MKFLDSLISKIFSLPTSAEIQEINRQIFEAPLEGVSAKEIIFNKHMQNLVWTFWFGKSLHKEEEKEKSNGNL